MDTISGSNIEQAMAWRYATKAFDPTRKIPNADWATLEEVLVLSPSSFGLQPWKFVVVTDQGIKDRLVPLSWNQTQVRDASHLVVFATKANVDVTDVDRHIERIAEVRGQTIESLAGYRGQMAGYVENPPPGVNLAEWAARQAYIAMGVFMASAAMMGIDTCPMEGINKPAYTELLGLDAMGYRTLACIPAGYRAADDPYAKLAKVRFLASELILRV